MTAGLSQPGQQPHWRDSRLCICEDGEPEVPSVEQQQTGVDRVREQSSSAEHSCSVGQCHLFDLKGMLLVSDIVAEALFVIDCFWS